MSEGTNISLQLGNVAHVHHAPRQPVVVRAPEFCTSVLTQVRVMTRENFEVLSCVLQ